MALLERSAVTGGLDAALADAATGNGRLHEFVTTGADRDAVFGALPARTVAFA